MKLSDIRLYKYYFDQDAMSAKLSIMVSLVIFFINDLEGGTPYQLAWLLINLTLLFMRLWHIARLRSLIFNRTLLSRNFIWTYVLVGASGVSWASIVFVFSSNKITYIYLFDIISIATINSMAIMSHGLIFPVYAIFSCIMTCVVLFQINFINQFFGGRDRYALTVLSIFYLFFLLVTSWKYSRRNREFFEQQVSMEGLVGKLKKMHGEESYLRSILEQKSARLEEAKNELMFIATTDSLTKIANRRSILQHLDRLILECDQFGKSFSIISFDVDNFKKINDTFGHQIGDLVLELLAKEVGSMLRDSDIFGRIGGEEFLILMPGLMLPDAVECAEHIRAHIEQNRRINSEAGFNITISMGCCLAFPGEAAVDILNKADKLMYDAKLGGKNCVFF